MGREYLRYGSIFVLITCIFALLVSCGSSGDDESNTGSITLSASLESIPADGVSSSAITAEVKDASGNPVVGGTSITFSTTLGTFSNGSASYTEKTPDDPEVDPTGIVIVSLIAGTTPGVADVTVKCNGVTQLISVEFTYAGPGGGEPVGEGFSLSPQYDNISGLWIAGLQDIITAWVLDVNGNAVADSTPIEFKTYNTGGLLDPYISATSGGFALSTLTSTPDPTPQQGFVSVTAETTGGPTTRVTSLSVTPTPYDYIMYAGTNGGGVYKSTNSGASWVNISRSSENPKHGQNWIYPYIKGHSAISVDPDDHNTVYAGTGYLGKGNVYRTLDGGMNWNSNNVEEWNGLYATNAAVLTVLCDGDDTATDYPYVWIGTEGRGVLYAADGENFQPSGGAVTTPVPGPGNTGNGTMSDPILSYSSQTETWTATCTVPEDASATVPVADDGNAGDGSMSNVTTSLTTKTEGWTVTYKGGASNVTSPGEMSATVPVPGANAGDGWMSNVTTSATSKSEGWTVTYKGGASNVTSPGEMSATVPVPGANAGDGWMSNVTTSATTKSEDWTVTYKGIADNVVSPAGKGTVVDIEVKAAVTETWTLTCIDDPDLDPDPLINGDETFSVTGSVSGPQQNAGVDENYNSDVIAFTIISGTGPFETGDQITFDTTTYWEVEGTVSRVQTNTATTGAYYTSDDGEVGFTIHAGSVPFAIGDTFTFSIGGKGTVGAIVVKAAVTETWTLTCVDNNGVFNVTGSVSGAQPNAIVDWYYNDSDVIAFEIVSGSVPFEIGDQITFDTTTFWHVSGTVSGAQTNTATTGTFYTSDGGEVGFTITERGVPFAIGDTFTFSIGGKGTVGNIEVKAAVTETWTLTCIDTTTWVNDAFSVTGSVSGAQPNAFVDTAYDSDAVAFEIVSGSVPFEVGDQITFDTTTYWEVEGTVSRVQKKTATTGAYYTSDGGEVGFTISEGSVPFAIGDSFIFSTTGAFAPFWIVKGTVSGLQWRWAENNVPYTSDNYEVSFTIYEGAIPFATGDTFTFSVTANTLSHGWTVWDIVKIPDTYGATATLYAATATGVFKSTNGGQTWDEPGSFTGDSITTLSLHPISAVAGNDDVIYAGTQNAGVWVSTNSGASWTQYPGGMELGQSATIKDILLDPVNDRLYAITFQGTPEQAEGNIYFHALNADGSMATGQWSKANTGLSGVGLHVMASDNPDNPGALFAGGEGINLYKATGAGLTTGAPAWQESKSGLTNLIMARKPILFSGECGLDVSYWEYEGAWYFTAYVQDINGNPPIDGSTFTAELFPSIDMRSPIAIFYDITYGDCYTHQGTFSDPGNPFTNNPYTCYFTPESGYVLKIEFTSADTRPDPPGYSGASQTLIYPF